VERLHKNTPAVPPAGRGRFLAQRQDHDHGRPFLQEILATRRHTRGGLRRYLDEHGDPDRADFIRAQCEMARMDVRDERSWELEAHPKAAAASAQLKWLGPLGEWRRRRSLPRLRSSGVRLEWGFLPTGRKSFGWPPVREVWDRQNLGAAADMAYCRALTTCGGSTSTEITANPGRALVVGRLIKRSVHRSCPGEVSFHGGCDLGGRDCGP